MDVSMLMTNWIWIPEWTPQDDADARIVYFRKEIELTEKPENKRIRISADSRYKLYVNGTFVQEGPQKALSLKEWFVDEAELAPFLHAGRNAVAVEVLRYPAPSFSSANAKSNDSLLRTEIPNLFVEDLTGGASLSGKSGWKCRINREINIVGEDERPAPIHAQERVSATDLFAGWKLPSFDDSDWSSAKPRIFFDIPLADAPGRLTARTIPPMRHEEKHFEDVVCLRDPSRIKKELDQALYAKALGAGMPETAARAAAEKEVGTIPLLQEPRTQQAWDRMLRGEGSVIIPAGTEQIVEISAGAEECGYLEYAFEGGKGAQIVTLCSECYAYPGKPDPKAGLMGAVPKPTKGDRTDFAGGKLFGHRSTYTAAGYGTPEAPECYEPYWFRTFRYVQLRVTTGEEPLTISRFTHRTTGYPLEVKTEAKASDPAFSGIWDISVRTLERCMHETYVDCPFYEQLQYAMDSRSEILYTYAVSADDRLARQAMEAFRLSQRPDGLINADAPVVKSNVIPGFSIYYVLMVYDHMMYFGDQQLVKQHLPAIDRVLAFFDSHLLSSGMVGKIGGPIMRHPYWSFIDWARKWDSGVPGAYAKGDGAITMESLLYLYDLQKAADLADFVQRTGLGYEYRNRAEALKAAIRKNCIGTYHGQKLVQDGPGVDEYSVHSQVFAILTGVVSPAEGKSMLQTTVGDPELPQASVAFMFYLFRALERCGWYEKTDELWEFWRQMLRDKMTTCVENDTDRRSDCHGWASLMCFELPAVILGVRPGAPGFAKVRLAPQMGKLTSASGSVITPRGTVHVKWTKTPEGSCDLQYTLPDGMEVVKQ